MYTCIALCNRRLSSVLEKSQGRVAIDNGSDRSDLYLGLTVLADVKGTDSSMLDEVRTK